MTGPLHNDLLFATMSKVMDLVAPYTSSRLLILMYHRFMHDNDEGYVTTQSVFRDQVEFIKRYFTVVALEEYLQLGESEKRKIRNPIALTVDDGYRNFYRHAFPVLKDSSVPATVYVPVNFIEHGQWMWQDKNKYILRNSSRPRITLEWNGLSHVFPVDTFEHLMDSLDKAYELCMEIPLEERSIFSQALAEAAGVTLPEKPVPEFEPLSWEEVREMEGSGIHFGSHTMNHEILTQVDCSVARIELSDSKRCLEERLGHEIYGFCYPNGSYSAEIVAAVEECGYRYAVTTEGGFNIDPLSLAGLSRETPPLTGRYRSMLMHCCLKPLGHHLMSRMRKVFNN